MMKKIDRKFTNLNDCKDFLEEKDLKIFTKENIKNNRKNRL
jgi:hypothetical protein